MKMVATWTIWTVLAAAVSAPATAQSGGAKSCRAVIDVHLHAYDRDGRFDDAVPNPETGAPMRVRSGLEHRHLLLRTMRDTHVVRGIVSNRPLSAQEAAVADSAGALRLGYSLEELPTEEDLGRIRQLHREGRLTSIGEVETPYQGIRYDDPLMEPLWDLAEELDLPVLLHTGAGPTDGYRNNPRKRLASTDVFALEEVILRHPKIRIVLQHMGYPMGDATLALMGAYSNIYLDTGATNWLVARPAFHSYLKKFVDAGYGDRIMFGSDAMTWPDAIPLAIQGVETSSLTSAQKRDVLYRNARRFFRWTDLPDC
jgi:predicted metal-dependent TIM-barrel fold hydrolase